MDAPTALEIPIRGASTVVRLHGELTNAAVGPVKAELLMLESTSGLVRLVLDLGGVDFVDSMGIALLLRMKRRSIDRGYTFSLAGLTEPVRARLDRSGLLGLLLDPAAPAGGGSVPAGAGGASPSVGATYLGSANG